jgi:hypothetical protein
MLETLSSERPCKSPFGALVDDVSVFPFQGVVDEVVILCERQ